MTELSNPSYAEKISAELSEVLKNNKDLASEISVAMDTIVYMMENMSTQAVALACSRMLPELMEIDLCIPEGATAKLNCEGVYYVSSELSSKERIVLEACYAMAELSGEDFHYVTMAISDAIPDSGSGSDDTTNAYDSYHNKSRGYFDIMQAGKEFYISKIDSANQ